MITSVHCFVVFRETKSKEDRFWLNQVLSPAIKIYSSGLRSDKGRGWPSYTFLQQLRPQFYFRTTDVTGVCDLPEGTEMCMPGDNVEMTVELIHPVAMEQGLTFRYP